MLFKCGLGSDAERRAIKRKPAVFSDKYASNYGNVLLTLESDVAVAKGYRKKLAIALQCSSRAQRKDRCEADLEDLPAVLCHCFAECLRMRKPVRVLLLL
eukprot:gnl/TRDRNA2_/TRDRNA2_125862_c2_seq1.p1 gnl/TRDRNA2_/TRDRNA2_125862_c2~~gnl/TRDRNA2_/TRDRNA2_125862_c2_seq1.p1  ORF type:complete len:100 (+),score=17.89 gnl/TRDRNA2_/TRDRNA2_125862_c2_seq1:262-561(+)